MKDNFINAAAIDLEIITLDEISKMLTSFVNHLENEKKILSTSTFMYREFCKTCDYLNTKLVRVDELKEINNELITRKETTEMAMEIFKKLSRRDKLYRIFHKVALAILPVSLLLLIVLAAVFFPFK